MLITAKHLKKSYQMGKVKIEAVRDVSLEIHKNAFVSIMGHYGTGKSTLMHIIGCLDKPDYGEYFLNGKDVSKIHDDELAEIRNKFIGFVFQTF
ncbi:macrolide ABC transporter ATP-binding protein, partial [candidate division TA06 bacterium]